MKDLLSLGTFEMTTPRMIVSDPCYDKGDVYTGLLKNCRTGQWEAGIDTVKDRHGYERVRALVVRFQDEKAPQLNDYVKAFRARYKSWKEVPALIGVDSGQAGFFDEAHYQDDASIGADVVIEHEYWTRWYNYCCDLTLEGSHGGVLPNGAVSGSGLGDGVYGCFAHYARDGVVDAAALIFLE